MIAAVFILWVGNQAIDEMLIAPPAWKQIASFRAYEPCYAAAQRLNHLNHFRNPDDPRWYVCEPDPCK